MYPTNIKKIASLTLTLHRGGGEGAKETISPRRKEGRDGKKSACGVLVGAGA